MELKELVEGWEGYNSIRTAKKRTDHDERLLEVVNLLTNKEGYASHKREYLLREAMTTSDFPYLFGEVLDRQLLAGFKDTPQVMPRICRPGRVKDFRTVHRYEISDGDQRLEKVAEKGEYLASDRDEAKYYYAISKYGRQFDISWEAIISDDLGALRDTPMRFAKAARRAEEYFLTSLFMDTNGPLDAVFSVARGGAAVAATPLTIGNLETGVEAMAAYTDQGASPILNRPKFLMIPPALEFTARQILTSATKMWIQGATTLAAAPDVARPMSNVISQYGLEILINPWIPIVAATGTVGATSWYLFSDPGDIPAAEFGLLTGHESPELFMKGSNQTRVGGGDASPMDGDFETDNIFYKVRHCFGGCVLSGRAGYASDGQ
uniref:Putative structural protein n=1 Tax=viral metagenome TaxID=1070528 RepID=A0A6M3KUT9_9ZZZZ